jgi:hypothetical protein
MREAALCEVVSAVQFRRVKLASPPWKLERGKRKVEDGKSRSDFVAICEKFNVNYVGIYLNLQEA